MCQTMGLGLGLWSNGLCYWSRISPAPSYKNVVSPPGILPNKILFPLTPGILPNKMFPLPLESFLPYFKLIPRPLPLPGLISSSCSILLLHLFILRNNGLACLIGDFPEYTSFMSPILNLSLSGHGITISLSLSLVIVGLH